ncbi:MAG: DUF5412 domain-containing protein [Eubacteriaceae bacterium]|nr:DUF5412 domain-containing protein [Eubacteriaceae bacterium]
MKKYNKYILIIIIVICLISYSIYSMFFDIQRLNGEEIINISTSPDGNYTLIMYVNNGGATVDFAVLGSIKNNLTNVNWNIYWQYHCNEVDVYWVNNDTVIINGIQLNVVKDTYDWRKIKE